NPVTVAGVNGVTAIAAGVYHTVALKSNGTLVAWGDNTYGQISGAAGQSGVSTIAAGGDGTGVLGGRPPIAFGNQNAGTTSAAKTFTIRNTGSLPLTITGAAFTALGNPGDFALNTTGMLATLAPGGQTTFSVTFTPTALGDRTATVRVFSNDAGE